jgi:GDP-4-dehydro-6-deoxy-D-mannose reductase
MSKARQTALALDYARRGLRVFLPRPFNLLGPGLPESFAPARLAREVARLGDAEELVVENPDTRRDFVDVRDVARAYWEILTHGRPGEIYNLCSGAAVSLEELARNLLEANGRQARIRRGEQTDPPAGLTIVGSSAKIRAELGWTPQISLTDSLRAMSAAIR